MVAAKLAPRAVASEADVWPAAKIERRAAAKLVPYARNARTHTEEQVAQIAAEMTGRQCFAIELSPAYVDVAVTRWEKFTGQAATLDGDGRTFAEVLAERLPAGAITAKAL